MNAVLLMSLRLKALRAKGYSLNEIADKMGFSLTILRFARF